MPGHKKLTRKEWVEERVAKAARAHALQQRAAQTRHAAEEYHGKLELARENNHSKLWLQRETNRGKLELQKNRHANDMKKAKLQKEEKTAAKTKVDLMIIMVKDDRDNELPALTNGDTGGPPPGPGGGGAEGIRGRKEGFGTIVDQVTSEVMRKYPQGTFTVRNIHIERATKESRKDSSDVDMD